MQIHKLFDDVNIIITGIHGFVDITADKVVEESPAEVAEETVAVAEEAAIPDEQPTEMPAPEEVVIEEVQADPVGSEEVVAEVATFTSEKTDQKLVDERDLGNDELIRTEYEVEKIQIDE